MWTVEYTRRFLKELSALPKEVQVRAEDLVFDELMIANPLERIERMKGYPDKFKIRVGDYRVGVTIDKQKKLIVFQRIAHRKDIYRLFP